MNESPVLEHLTCSGNLILLRTNLQVDSESVRVSSSSIISEYIILHIVPELRLTV